MVRFRRENTESLSSFIHRQKMALMVQTMVFTYSLSSVSSNKYEFYRGAATSVGAVNGRDERRTSAPPLTAPPGLALRLSRRASTRSACPPPLILGRIASHGGIDFRRGGNQSPIAWERLRSQAVVEMGLDLRPISTETYIKLREVLIVAVYGLKPLQFLGFCDTILILRKRTASNKQAKH